MDIAPVDDWTEELVDGFATCDTRDEMVKLARVWIRGIIKYMEHEKEQSCQENQYPKS